VNPFLEAWQGHTKLWIVFWIYGVAVSYAVEIVMDRATTVGPWLEWALLPVALAWFVWATVALWRCAFNCNWEGWGYLARISVVASVAYAVWSIGELLLEVATGAY
jgi:hypothetical protein